MSRDRGASPRRARRPSLAARRGVVRRLTRLRPVPGIPEIRLHLADEVEPVWAAIAATTPGDGLPADAPIPFWAFAWSGGLGLARYVLDHSEEVRDRRVLDMAAGSGLVSIAAALGGATAVTAADIDPFAEAAVALNARANSVEVEFVGRDLLAERPPKPDVLLAGDTWYESRLGERMLPWLRAAAAGGVRILVGDPGRRYLPADAFVEIAAYDVETTTELEDRTIVRSRVFTLAR